MQSPNRRRLSVNERLHAQADAIHATFQKTLDPAWRERPGRTLNGNLRIRRHFKLLSNRIEDSLQLKSVEHRRRSTAEINRVDFLLDPPAHLFRSSRCIADVRTHAIHIAPKDSPRKYGRREVAVAALCAAERNRDVDAQGHCSDYPTLAPFPCY